MIIGLLSMGCHSSRKDIIKPDVTEYDRPTTKGVDSKTGRKLVAEARKWIGTRYCYGGETRKGTDCSGMVMCIYRDVTGIKLPRDSRSQQSFTNRIKRSELSPGDLVFFASKAGGDRVGHVGLYIGNDEFIHASSSKGVIISKLGENYYKRHFHSAGRVPGVKTDKVKQTKNPAAKHIPQDSLSANNKPVEITLDRFIEISKTDTTIQAAPDTIIEIVRSAFD